MPNNELGIGLHEIWMVPGLLMGDYPYKEYILTLQELCMLKNQNAPIYMMLWELDCHFHISISITSSKGVFIWYN